MRNETSQGGGAGEMAAAAATAQRKRRGGAVNHRGGKPQHLPVAVVWQRVSVMACHYTRDRKAAPSALAN